MDTNATQAAREAQDSQMSALNGMAEFVRIIAELLAKLSGQDIKLDDLTLRSGTKKVWPSNDENFELTAKLKDALVDPESKASFRVMLEYSDGSKVEIFRQTAGKVIVDEYGLAPALRAHFAAEAAAKFAEVERPKIVIEADGLDNVATTQESTAQKGYTFDRVDDVDSIIHKDRGVVFAGGKFAAAAIAEDISALEALVKYQPLVELGSTFSVEDGYTSIVNPRDELMVLHPDRGIVLQNGEFTANAIDLDKFKLDVLWGAPGDVDRELLVTQLNDRTSQAQVETSQSTLNDANVPVVGEEFMEGSRPLTDEEIAARATELGQKLETRNGGTKLEATPEPLTYSQQRETARLDDVLGQIAELDRRAAAGMTYIADPAQNQGYKALQDEAIALKAKLGITEPQSVNTEIADLNAEFQKEAAALRSELEAPDAQDAKAETAAQAIPVTIDKPISQSELNEAAILGAIAAPSTEAISSGVNAKDLAQESNFAAFSVAADAIAVTESQRSDNDAEMKQLDASIEESVAEYHTDPQAWEDSHQEWQESPIDGFASLEDFENAVERQQEYEIALLEHANATGEVVELPETLAQQLPTQEKNEAFVTDGVRNAALEHDSPFGRLAENAVNTIAAKEILGDRSSNISTTEATTGSSEYKNLFYQYPTIDNYSFAPFDSMHFTEQLAADNIVAKVALSQGIDPENFTRILAQGSGYVQDNLDNKVAFSGNPALGLEGNGAQMSVGLDYLSKQATEYRNAYIEQVSSAYIPPIEKLNDLDFTGQTVDVTPLNDAPADSDGAINSVSIQPFLAEVSALSTQIEALRQTANEKLGQVMHLSTGIVAEAQTPDIERWSEQIGTVALTNAQSWGDRLRDAASNVVDTVKERAANDWQIVVDTVTEKAAEVKEFVQERAATDWDATKEVVQDRVANDWQTTKEFIAEKATDAWIGVQEWALGSADVNKSIDALVGAMAEGEPTHGMIEHNGYIIARQGEDRGVFRAEDKVAVFKDGLLTPEARTQDSAYVSKLPQFSAEVNRAAETLEKHNSASENASRSSAPSMKR